MKSLHAGTEWNHECKNRRSFWWTMEAFRLNCIRQNLQIHCRNMASQQLKVCYRLDWPITNSNHTATFCGESDHHMLKRYMLTNMSNLLSCCKKLYLANVSSIAEHDMFLTRQQMRLCNYAQPTLQRKKNLQTAEKFPSAAKKRRRRMLSSLRSVWGPHCKHEVRQ